MYQAIFLNISFFGEVIYFSKCQTPKRPHWLKRHTTDNKTRHQEQKPKYKRSERNKGTLPT